MYSSEVQNGSLTKLYNAQFDFGPNANALAALGVNGIPDIGKILNGGNTGINNKAPFWSLSGFDNNLDSDKSSSSLAGGSQGTGSQASSADQTNVSKYLLPYLLMLANLINTLMTVLQKMAGYSDTKTNEDGTSSNESSDSSYYPYTGSTGSSGSGSTAGGSSYYPYTGSSSSSPYALSSGVSSTAPGRTNTQLNFEDGKYPGTLPETQEPARIMTDSNGNKFLRFTANYGDQQAVPSQYKDRVRATMYMAGGHWEQPELNDSNKHMSYSADIRFIDNKSRRGYYNNSFFELFQGSDKYKSTGYDANDSASGPPVKFVRLDNGHVCLQTTQENGAGKDRTCKQYDLGYFAPGEFHNFRLDATWDEQNGGYKVFVDGKPRLDLQGINTCYNPGKSNLVPAMKCGMYGGNAVGSVDVDNVLIKNQS